MKLRGQLSKAPRTSKDTHCLGQTGAFTIQGVVWTNHMEEGAGSRAVIGIQPSAPIASYPTRNDKALHERGIVSSVSPVRRTQP